MTGLRLRMKAETEGIRRAERSHRKTEKDKSQATTSWSMGFVLCGQVCLVLELCQEKPCN